MASMPKTQYTKSGDLHIAYQVSGAGGLVPGFVSHLEYGWEHPWAAHYFERLGTFSRLIRFDKRGTGLALLGIIRCLMSRELALVLVLLLTGCASQVPNTRTVDSEGNAHACQSIRSAVLARDASALTVLDVLCNGDLVVIAGALPPDYTPAVEAVHIARMTPGVRRVETFFVPRSAREASDSALATRVRTAVAGNDGAAAATDLTVIAGTVVLVGVVDDQAKADQVVASIGAVSGVKSVKSFLRVKP